MPSRRRVELAAGAALAVYAARQASTRLFGLEPGDPSTLAVLREE